MKLHGSVYLIGAASSFLVGCDLELPLSAELTLSVSENPSDAGDNARDAAITVSIPSSDSGVIIVNDSGNNDAGVNIVDASEKEDAEAGALINCVGGGGDLPLTCGQLVVDLLPTGNEITNGLIQPWGPDWTPQPIVLGGNNYGACYDTSCVDFTPCSPALSPPPGVVWSGTCLRTQMLQGDASTPCIPAWNASAWEDAGINQRVRQGYWQFSDIVPAVSAPFAIEVVAKLPTGFGSWPITATAISPNCSVPNYSAASWENVPSCTTQDPGNQEIDLGEFPPVLGGYFDDAAHNFGYCDENTNAVIFSVPDRGDFHRWTMIVSVAEDGGPGAVSFYLEHVLTGTIASYTGGNLPDGGLEPGCGLTSQIPTGPFQFAQGSTFGGQVADPSILNGSDLYMEEWASFRIIKF